MSVPTLDAPVVTESPRRLTLYQHQRATEADIPAAFARAFEALYARIGQAGVVPAGPPFAIYHNEPEPGAEFDFDICVPLSAAISASPDFEFIELPATRVVSLLHVGPYDTLGKTYEALKAYIAEHGLTATAPPREFYLSAPDVPPEQVQTLVEFPIA